MPPETKHRCSVRLVCRSSEHDLCYPIGRGVPPELRCDAGKPAGYGSGSGGCCTLPPDLDAQVRRQLRENFQESKRQGFVLIRVE